MRPPVNKELGRGAVIGITTSKQVTVALRARPLPAEVTDFLLKNAGAIKQLYSDRKETEGADLDETNDENKIEEDAEISEAKILSPEDLKKQLQTHLETGKGREAWKNVADKIASFGPRRAGPNLLIDATASGCFPKAFSAEKNRDNSPSADEKLQAGHFCDKITYAFQLASAQGPLCSEPVQGLAVFIEDVSIAAAEDEAPARDRISRLTGEVIKTVQQSIHKGFLDWSPRLMLAMYSCEIQASSRSPSTCHCRRFAPSFYFHHVRYVCVCVCVC
jgi:ribosome assembly protein 1